MPAFIDITGQRFGRWVVLSRGPDKVFSERSRHPRFYVRCDCGNEKLVTSMALRNGDSKSCGCFNLEVRRQVCFDRNTTHGKSGTKVFNTWVNIRQRCENPKVKSYEKYGAKGVRVCDRWQSFDNFYADMGDPPTKKHTIERKDNSKGYEPGNCCWATMKEQQNNRTNNHLITYNGKTQTLMQWSQETGISRRTIKARLYELGWDIDEVFNIAPLKGRNQHLPLFIEYRGDKYNLRDLAEKLGINRKTLWDRHKKGIPLDAPLRKPRSAA